MVTPDATELLVVIYAPMEIPKTQLENVATATAERMKLILSGEQRARALP